MVADGEKDSQENTQVEEEEQPSNTYVIRPNYQHKYVSTVNSMFACLWSYDMTENGHSYDGVRRMNEMYLSM